MSINGEIVSNNIFHLVVNIVHNNDHFCDICGIDASCHYALCCVIIMNPMIHMYFISEGRKGFKIIWTRGCHIFGFMVVAG
jgi:hypothetical protein